MSGTIHGKGVRQMDDAYIRPRKRLRVDAKNPYTMERQLTEGTHQHDVYMTTKLLEEARRIGMISVNGTPDGDIFIFFNAPSRKYEVGQVVNGVTVTFVKASRHQIQAYLIDLRERARKEAQKRKPRRQEGA
jgi:hypothetical protein